MSFWSGDKLKQDGRRLQVIDPFVDAKIDCSAYTLTLGSEYFVTPDHKTNSFAHRKGELGEHRTISGISDILPAINSWAKQKSMVIPAGQFGFLLTREKVKIPADAMGFISLKSKFKFRGLINVSGFHVDPGYEGHLIYSVYNAGPSPISMDFGEDLFLLWIADLDRVSSVQFTKHVGPAGPMKSISTDLINNVNHPVQSLQSLTDEIEKLKAKQNIFQAMFNSLGWIIAVISLLFAALAYWDAHPELHQAKPAVVAVAPIKK